MAKGEMQFTTIALLVITAVVLIAVIIWFLPSFTKTGSELTDIGADAGVDGGDVKCASLCFQAQQYVEGDVASVAVDTEFCSEDTCDDTFACTGVDCGAAD
jgi:hypothetical protein